MDSFVGFAIVLGLFIPAGAMIAQPWNTALFVPIAANFVPILGPANQMSYNTIQFYNTALAIVAGCAAGAPSFPLIPPLSPQVRSRRLLALSLRDLRRLVADPSVAPRVPGGTLVQPHRRVARRRRTGATSCSCHVAHRRWNSGLLTTTPSSNVRGDRPPTKRLTKVNTRSSKPKVPGRNGSLQMTGSTKPLGKPSPPVMHYLLSKARAVASCRRWDMVARPMAACAPRERLQPEIPDTSEDAS
jgi:hypothetical protein